jgi:hypothetical protein
MPEYNNSTIYISHDLVTIRLQYYPNKDMFAWFSHKHTVMYSVSMYVAYYCYIKQLFPCLFFSYHIILFCVNNMFQEVNASSKYTDNMITLIRNVHFYFVNTFFLLLFLGMGRMFIGIDGLINIFLKKRFCFIR